MLLGERIRELREAKGLSQGELERRSGLLRCYIARVEHGHTVPSLETLERLAAALGVPLYRLLDEGDEPMEGWPMGENDPGFFDKLRTVFHAVNAQFPSPWDAVLFYALALLTLTWIIAHIFVWF
jgi:DNA-binding XRE family transcriptional regulator